MVKEIEKGSSKKKKKSRDLAFSSLELGEVPRTLAVNNIRSLTRRYARRSPSFRRTIRMHSIG